MTERIKFELKKLLGRKKLSMIVGTGVNDRRFRVGRSEGEVAVGTMGCGNGILLMFKRVKLTSLFDSEIINETRRKEMATAVVALMKINLFFIFNL